MNAMPYRLPQVELRWKGTKPPWKWRRWSRWFCDDRLGELRRIDNPHKRVSLTVVAFAQLAGQVEVRRVEGEEGGE